MTYPPIPEFCPFFQKSYQYKREWFNEAGRLEHEWVFSIWGSSDQPLDLRFTYEGFNHRNPWLKIIGIVAWGAWMDLYNETGDGTPLRNADEWNEWSKQW